MKTQRDITINQFLELTRCNTCDAAFSQLLDDAQPQQWNVYMSKGISPKLQRETFNLLFHSQTDYDLRNLLKQRVNNYRN